MGLSYNNESSWGLGLMTTAGRGDDEDRRLRGERGNIIVKNQYQETIHYNGFLLLIYGQNCVF